MTTLEYIEQHINMIKANSLLPLAIIINPKIEREIFISGEIKKSESLESYFSLPVILTTQIENFLIAV